MISEICGKYVGEGIDEIPTYFKINGKENEFKTGNEALSEETMNGADSIIHPGDAVFIVESFPK